MKPLVIISFFIFSITTNSQGFCEYGEYDFLFNTITGVTKFPFKKVILKHKDKNVYVENYNKQGRLVDSNYNETVLDYSIDMDNPCYSPDEDEIAQKTIKYDYEYLKNGNIKKVDVYLKDGSLEKINPYSNNRLENVYFYRYDCISKQLKAIEAGYLEIEHKYYENGLLKRIDRNGKTFDFFWNEKQQLKKIIVIPTDYFYDEHFLFSYNSNNTINTITLELYNKATKKKYMEYLDSFCYNNDKLKKIISTGISIEGNKKEKIEPHFFEFDYSKNNKLIINNLDENKKYVKHYECYYFK